MKPNTVAFIRKVLFTTAIAFLFITMFYLLTMIWLIDPGPVFHLSTSLKYLTGKLFCVFLFSLSLGFLNRIPEAGALSRFSKRLIHFFASFLSYVLFMNLLFSRIWALFGVLEASEVTLKSEDLLINSVIFLVAYFLTLALVSLGRALFLPKKEEKFKSILE